MITICTATYVEAEPFIKNFNLKKNLCELKFQIFNNNDMRLIITGIGKIKSAIALTYLFTKYKPSFSDILINIGLCGSSNKNYNIGDIFLCNKIIDHDSNKTYFTDILFKHPFKETSIETCSSVAGSNTILQSELTDMESSGIYESALTFIQPHEVFFIKIISDYLSTDKIDINIIKDILSKSADKIIGWINSIKDEFSFDDTILSPKDIQAIDSICDNLKLSCTMKNELKQLAKYYVLQNNDFSEIIKYTHMIHCKTKKEGKIYLEKLKQKFI
ncbi:MAG: hypothetical protein ACI398_05815 [Clostridium sp.]